MHALLLLSDMLSVFASQQLQPLPDFNMSSAKLVTYGSSSVIVRVCVDTEPTVAFVGVPICSFSVSFPS